MVNDPVQADIQIYTEQIKIQLNNEISQSNN